MTLPQVTSTLFQNINSRPTTVATPEARPMIWSGPPYKASSSGLIIIALVSFQLEVLVNPQRINGTIVRQRASGTSNGFPRPLDLNTVAATAGEQDQ